ncbi:beta strand repeat-containing protein [Deinococcus hopiensis]|nr:hypothetical protein [Deinococcus hopiensis]
MTALTMGSAAAVPLATGSSAGTSAGTTITNTAAAGFDDPSGGATPSTVTSNTVVSKVTAIAGFDILYGDGSTDDVASSNAPTNYNKTNVVPDDTVYSTYRVVNNGNIENYVVNLTVTGSLPTTQVKYYLDADRNGTPDDINSPITSVTLPNGGYVDIVQVVNVPTTLGRGTVVYEGPLGYAPGGTINGVSYNTYNESSNENTPGTPASNGDLQPTSISIYAPTAVVGPNSYPDGNGTGTYTDPNTSSTNIVRQGDTQTATVQPGTSTAAFIDTIKNTGAISDSFVLSTSAYTNMTSVVFKTPSGAAITSTPVVENGITYVTDSNGNPVVKNIPAGGTANYQAIGTYDARYSTTSFTVAIESTSDSDSVTEDTTGHVILVPHTLFGDQTNNGPDATLNPNPNVNPGSTATLLMQVKNTGGSSDTYSFTSTQVAFQVVDASGNITTQNVPVTYAADTNCNGTTDVGETLPLTLVSNATGCVIATATVPANALKGQTPPLTQTMSSTGNITALDTNDTVNVTLTFTTTPSNKGVLVAKFTSKAGVSAGSETESNTGLTNPANYTLSQTTALPGGNISYRIVAKNVYNTSVAKFFLQDSVPADTTLQSYALAQNNVLVAPADTIFSVNNGTTWTSVLNGASVNPSSAAGTTYLVAVDTDHNNVPDALGPNQTLQLDFVVKVN